MMRLFFGTIMKKLIILVIVVGLAGTVVYLNRQGGASPQPVAISGTTMGTSYHIKLVPVAGQNVDSATLKQKIDARLTEIDAEMSTYKEDSDVSRFNRAITTDWQNVNEETLSVLATAAAISQLSQGAFDITVGKLVNLWGFGPTVNLDDIPPADKITRLLTDVGYAKVELRKNPPAIKKSDPNVTIDLSAIAKGYAVDAVAKLLLEEQQLNFLVEIGGEIITHGFKQNHKRWVIGIESPVADQHSVRKRLYLEDVAMATSGDYRNYFERNGVRYSHTIDPTTGYPIKHRLASVTVIEQSCMRADALATALMVMGPDRGMAFAERHQLAIFMLVKQNDSFIAKHSTAFTPYLTVKEVQ
jgi:thiamine biosynthesis lipoprotein